MDISPGTRCPGGACCDCEKCNDRSEFQKLLKLKNGLVIYWNTDRQIAPDERNETALPLLASPRPHATEDMTDTKDTPADIFIIIHNTENKEANVADILHEFDVNKLNCPRCRHILKRAKKIVENVSTVKSKETIGICELCRLREQFRAPCQYCQKAIEKFKSTEPSIVCKENTLKKQLLSLLTNAKADVITMEAQGRFKAYSDIDVNEALERKYYDQSLDRPKSGSIPYSKTQSKKNIINIKIEVDLKNEVPEKVTGDYYSEDKKDRTLLLMKPAEKQAPQIIKTMKKTPYHFGLQSDTVLGVGTTGIMRKSRSDESLITSFSGITEEMFKKNFKYFFPKEIKKQETIVKTSEELITDTRDRFQAETEEKLKKEEDRKLKQLEKQREKEIAIEEIKRKAELARRERLSDIDIKSRKITQKRKEAADKEDRDSFATEKSETKRHKTKLDKTMHEPKEEKDKRQQRSGKQKEGKEGHVSSEKRSVLEKDHSLSKKGEKPMRETEKTESERKGKEKEERYDKKEERKGKEKEERYDKKEERKGKEKEKRLDKKDEKKGKEKEERFDKKEERKDREKPMKEEKISKKPDTTKTDQKQKGKETSDKKKGEERDRDKPTKETKTSKQPDTVKTDQSLKDKERFDKVKGEKQDREKAGRKEKIPKQLDTGETQAKSKQKEERKDMQSAKEKGEATKGSKEIYKKGQGKSEQSDKVREDGKEKVKGKHVELPGETRAEKGKQKSKDKSNYKFEDKTSFINPPKLMVKPPDGKKNKPGESTKEGKKGMSEDEALSSMPKRPEKKKMAEVKEKPTKTVEGKGKQVAEVNAKDIKYLSSGDDLILKLVRSSKPFREVASTLPLIAPPKPSTVIRKVIKKPLVYDPRSEIELDMESLLRKQLQSKKVVEPEIIFGKNICLEKDIPQEREHQAKPDLFESVFKAEPVLDEERIIPEPVIEQKPDVGGVFRYVLSDRKFIDKGWTVLPTEKVLRKVNMYRMRPAKPEFDWFVRNKGKGLMQYDSGEKLAEVADDGRGRWYYKNGRLALDYYDSEDLHAQQRVVVYSSGEPDERGRSRPVTVLGMFDHLGSGVVFDHRGKIRLKYNQNEGVILDRDVGPETHWLWHSLNEPPELQQVMIDTHLPYKNPEIAAIEAPDDRQPRPSDEEMVAIEFDNLIKSRSMKPTQKFEPFQIRMKALKLNSQFSLKVIDQKTIYLLFREGSSTMKLNLGMKLDQTEILDTRTAEVNDVSVDVDAKPAMTASIENLQRSLMNIQRLHRVRTERQLRTRPLCPSASADKLAAAISKPLRAPLLTVDPPNQSRCRTVPTPNLLYYNTRLI